MRSCYLHCILFVMISFTDKDRSLVIEKWKLRAGEYSIRKVCIFVYDSTYVNVTADWTPRRKYEYVLIPAICSNWNRIFTLSFLELWKK